MEQQCGGFRALLCGWMGVVVLGCIHGNFPVFDFSIDSQPSLSHCKTLEYEMGAFFLR